jgi:uncharacterized Zn finger protein
MIELTSAEQLAKATARAKAGNLLVQTTSIFRQYRVTNRDNGKQYVVNFFIRDGKRYGHCTCKAGERNLVCKHLSASAGYHVMRAAARREAERIASMPQAA